VFNPEPSTTWIRTSREQVVAIIESINQPQVSIPGKPSQQMFGYLVGIRNVNGTFSINVALHAPRTGENVVYAHEQRQLAVEQYRDVEIEGLQFLESMGFMLDNVNFRNLDATLQEQTLRRIPLFSAPRAVGEAPAAAARSSTASDRGRVARLLAAF
jgi:hypothetical protein